MKAVSTGFNVSTKREIQVLVPLSVTIVPRLVSLCFYLLHVPWRYRRFRHMIRVEKHSKLTRIANSDS